MPDVELAHRYLRLSDEAVEVRRGLVALRRDPPALTVTLGAEGAAKWRSRSNWVTDQLNGLDEQMTRHTAQQGDIPPEQLPGWLRKAERLATEWEAVNAEGRALITEATPHLEGEGAPGEPQVTQDLSQRIGSLSE